MKLFVWRDVFWGGHTPGVAIAMAESEYEAREILVQEYSKSTRENPQIYSNPNQAIRDAEKYAFSELRAEPEIWGDDLHALILTGGD